MVLDSVSVALVQLSLRIKVKAEVEVGLRRKVSDFDTMFPFHVQL